MYHLFYYIVSTTSKSTVISWINNLADHFLYKHRLPNNHKTSALPPLGWVYGQASHFHIQGQQNSVLILGLIFFSLLPKEPTGNQFTPQIRYQTAYFVSLSYTITIQLALSVKWGWSVIGQFHINQWFLSTQAKLKESVNIISGKKGQSIKISIYKKRKT